MLGAKRKPVYGTLFARMLTTYLLLILGVLLVLGITLGAVFRNFYIAQKEMELKRECEMLAQVASELYYTSAWRPAADEQLSASARRFDALVQLRFTDASMPKVSFFDEASRLKWMACDEVDLTADVQEMVGLSGVYMAEGMFAELISFPVMSMRMSFGAEGEEEHTGVLYMHVDLSDMYETIYQVYADMVLAMLIAVLVCVFCVLYITDSVTRPITNMKNTVTRYTKGDFDARVDCEGRDEVAELASSFNLMADELSQLEFARKSFVANVSHEMRSPLTAMRGFIQAMLDGVIEPQDREKYLKLVLDENIRMTNMVNDLLDLAKIESGDVRLNLTVFDINQLVSNVLLTFEVALDEKRLKVVARFDEKQRLYVKADADGITQVLHNLIHNAIKFTEKDGCITLSTSADDKLVYVSVEDTGCGIEPSSIPRVFDRFYKAEAAHTPSNTSGTGLGLAIAKRIIDNHGRSIEVASEPGAGTRFTFTLQRVRRPSPSVDTLSQIIHK
ncbi:MAG: HAMP domain-containing sensor histidine kinase [Clostridia bacterium]|nr:HAMP domain-containing sensor histidine kinase [Clostridia bacterium]